MPAPGKLTRQGYYAHIAAAVTVVDSSVGVLERFVFARCIQAGLSLLATVIRVRHRYIEPSKIRYGDSDEVYHAQYSC